LGGQLPLPPGLQGYLATKYGADGSVRIFVGVTEVFFFLLLFVLLFLITLLVIPLVVTLTILPTTAHPLARI
jgi:maltodextrin utilization protein YvdJ